MNPKEIKDLVGNAIDHVKNGKVVMKDLESYLQKMYDSIEPEPEPERAFQKAVRAFMYKYWNFIGHSIGQSQQDILACPWDELKTRFNELVPVLHTFRKAVLDEAIVAMRDCNWGVSRCATLQALKEKE